MRWWLGVVSVILGGLVAGSALACDGKAREELIEIRFQGDKRKALYFEPASVPCAQARPLVIALHGGGGSIDSMANHYNFKREAEKYGWPLLVPNGVGVLGGSKFATWNAGACCGRAMKTGSDDVAFIRAALHHAKQNGFKFDASRVYASGMSNGAMMSYQLACTGQGLVRAIAPVSGTDNTLSCNPPRPVPVLHIHGRQDQNVLFDGGCGPNCVTGTDFVSVPATMAKWRKINHTGDKPRSVEAKPGFRCTLWQGTGAPVALCVIEEGGHSWPGGEKFYRRQPEPSRAMDATARIYEFFKSF